MGLESATYVSDLVTSNPAGTDLKSQGDDHIRLLKATLKTTFPNATKPFYARSTTTLQSSNFSVASPTDCGKLIPVNGGVNVTLPNSPAFDNFEVSIIKADHSSGVVTVAAGGVEINGLTSFVIYQRYQTARFVWSSALSVWFAFMDELPAIGSIMPIMAGVPVGYVLANATTIGRDGSAATLAAKYCQGLYEVLWNNVVDTYCPVSTGRGASAAADFTAGKTLGLPDLRGRTLAGLDTMGNSAAARLTAMTSLGKTIGAETHTLLTAEMPAHNHSITDPTHSHAYGYVGAVGQSFTGPGGGTAYVPYGSNYTNPATTGITINNAGGGGAHNNVQPTSGVNWALKL